MDLVAITEKFLATLQSMKARKDHSLENKFLSSAEKDLKTCEILYEEGIHPLAVYHLQQSVEKAAKAWVLFLAVVTEDQLKNEIGHRTPRAFLKLLDESLIGDVTHSLVGTLYPKVSTDTSKVRTLVEHESMDVARMDYRGIRFLLDFLYKVDAEVASRLRTISGLFGKSLGTDLDFADIIMAFISLYIISGITFPHHEYTRYPGLGIEPSNYTKDFGIVKALPELIPITKKCIDTVSKLISL